MALTPMNPDEMIDFAETYIEENRFSQLPAQAAPFLASVALAVQQAAANDCQCDVCVSLRTTVENMTQ